MLGWLFFEREVGNWFVYLSRPFHRAAATFGQDPTARLVWFIVSASFGMLFSPIGEEILYRGVVHESFAEKFGDRVASYIDSAAFAITHLAHFGIVYTAMGWRFLPIPATLWVLLMFLSSQVFYFGRIRSRSLFGAMVSHAGFNLAMIYCIFFWVL